VLAHVPRRWATPTGATAPHAGRRGQARGAGRRLGVRHWPRPGVVACGGRPVLPLAIPHLRPLVADPPVLAVRRTERALPAADRQGIRRPLSWPWAASARCSRVCGGTVRRVHGDAAPAAEGAALGRWRRCGAPACPDGDAASGSRRGGPDLSCQQPGRGAVPERAGRDRDGEASRRALPAGPAPRSAPRRPAGRRPAPLDGARPGSARGLRLRAAGTRGRRAPGAAPGRMPRRRIHAERFDF
jgi:hypothetical protein